MIVAEHREELEGDWGIGINWKKSLEKTEVMGDGKQCADWEGNILIICK